MSNFKTSPESIAPQVTEETPEIEEEPPILESPSTLRDSKSIETKIVYIQSLPSKELKFKKFTELVDEFESLNQWRDVLRAIRLGEKIFGLNVSEFHLYHKGKALLNLNRQEEAEAYLLDGIFHKRNQTVRIYDLLISLYRASGEKDKVRIFTQLRGGINTPQ